MATGKIPRRISQALLNSLAAGVVPRLGLEHITVGREVEVAALLDDLETISQGGTAFRLIVGRYGAGKSFLLQLLRNHALERGFAVADADLSVDRRLTGTDGQGLHTYRELVKNLSTKARPDGGALPAILERWISGLQSELVRQGLDPSDRAFGGAVEGRIHAVASELHGLVSGFDFAQVVVTYWRGHAHGDDARKDAALRWLRGEFTTKTEVRTALGIRTIVDDDSWYEHVKLLAHFASLVGYKGLLILLDEAVNLSRIPNATARQGNYEKLLTIFNDLLQGRVDHLGFFLAGTPQSLEDPRRGVFSYDALRSRLSESRFTRDGYRDIGGPVLRMNPLTPDDIYALLRRIAEIHRAHHGTSAELTPQEYALFMQETLNRVGGTLLTPRDIIRDFVSLLNILRHHPNLTVAQVLRSSDFQPTAGMPDPAASEDEFAEFTL